MKKKIIINVLIMIVLAFVILYEPNYMITKPGGIESVSKSYQIDGNNTINGSINITYVESVKPNLIYYWYAKIRKYDITKTEDYAPNGLEKEDYLDSLMYISSIDNAIYNAYKYAGKDITIKNEKVYVEANLNDQSDLLPGDLILEVDGNVIKKREEIISILNSTTADTVKIKYLRDDKEAETDVKIIKTEKRNYIGISVIDIFDYETDPHIDFSIKDDVAGPSGGAMMTLSIYASLMDEDIINGLKIAGSGTIDRDGNVGPIGSIELKIKSALKEDVDVFFVPKYINYFEVLNMDIDFKDMEIIPVENFDDILYYLSNKK